MSIDYEAITSTVTWIIEHNEAREGLGLLGGEITIPASMAGWKLSADCMFEEGAVPTGIIGSEPDGLIYIFSDPEVPSCLLFHHSSRCFTSLEMAKRVIDEMNASKVEPDWRDDLDID